MSKPSLATALAMLLPIALSACSGNDGDGTTTYGSIPSTFAGYCTGTLSVEKELSEPYQSGWMGNGDLKAAAGSLMLVGDDFGGWSGYVFESDGSPRMVDAPFGEGLKEGTDFTSDCLGATKVHVLLVDANVYQNEQLTGTACKVPAGTTMTSFSFKNDLELVTVSSDEVKQLCGWDVTYTKSFIYAELLSK